MKRISYILVGLLIIVGVSALFSNARHTQALGITYYISSSTGNDSNNGLSPSGPWKSLDKIFIKSYSNSPFQPGDKILLKSGDTFNGQVRIKAVGNSANPITLGAYDTGAKPIIVGEIATNWSPVAGFPNIYVTNVGQGSVVGPTYEGTTKLKAIPWNADLNTFLSTFILGSYGSATTTDKIYIKTLSGAAPTTADRLFRSGTVTIDPGSSYLKIENLSIERGSTGVDFNGTNNITVSNVDVKDTLGIGIYARISNSSCLVENNSTLRTGNDGIYFYQSTNCVARNNTISTVTNNIVGIPTIGDQCALGLQESQNSLVEKNNINNTKCGIDYYLDNGSEVRNNYLYQAGGILPHGTNMKVHNNIINLQANANGTNAVETGTGKSYIYNNTYYNPSGYGLMGSSAGGQVIFNNNLVHTNSNSPLLVDFGANVLSDYNSFYTTGSSKWRDNAITYTSLLSYQTSSGKDKNSFFGNPLLVNPTGTTALDFNLQANSSCIDKGLNLVAAGAVPAYSDFNNISIPQGSGTDIGAYEYISSVPILNIIKSVDKTQAAKGEIITYVLQYSTISNITNARIEDLIPLNTTYVDGSASNNGSLSSGKVIWNLGDLAAGVSGIVSFQVKVN